MAGWAGLPGEGARLLLQDSERGMRGQGPPQQHPLHRLHPPLRRAADPAPPPPRAGQPRARPPPGHRGHPHLLSLLQVYNRHSWLSCSTLLITVCLITDCTSWTSMLQYGPIKIVQIEDHLGGPGQQPELSDNYRSQQTRA